MGRQRTFEPDLREAADSAADQSMAEIRASFDALSDQIDQERIQIEEEVARLREAGDEREAAAALSAFMSNAADRAIATAVEQANRLRQSTPAGRLDRIR